MKWVERGEAGRRGLGFYFCVFRFGFVKIGCLDTRCFRRCVRALAV